MIGRRIFLDLGLAILLCALDVVTTPPHDDRCPVHGLELVGGVVPIRFGRGAEVESIEDGDLGFPYARTYMAGGCVDDGRTLVRTSYCPRCRKLKQAWEAEWPDRRHWQLLGKRPPSP
jgi:hypothetical protein